MKRFLVTMMLIGGALSLGAQAALAEGRAQPSFAQLDADGNGEVTQEEMRAFGADRFAGADTDGNGALSRAELEAQASRMAQRRIERMMTRLDSDGDGVLSSSELAAQDMPRRAGRMFKRADTDGSGGLSEAEFDAARAKMQARRANKG
ncbi:MAG: calcium-binding protein [Pseudomonadota bacterium]